jgi:hypothetical protein
MILQPNDVSYAHCPRCEESTLNLCASCGYLKSSQLVRCGRLPMDEVSVITGRTPSWLMLHIACAIASIGGFIAGVTW